jgi:hypothetical protein
MLLTHDSSGGSFVFSNACATWLLWRSLYKPLKYITRFALNILGVVAKTKQVWVFDLENLA